MSKIANHKVVRHSFRGALAAAVLVSSVGAAEARTVEECLAMEKLEDKKDVEECAKLTGPIMEAETAGAPLEERPLSEDEGGGTALVPVIDAERGSRFFKGGNTIYTGRLAKVRTINSKGKDKSQEDQAFLAARAKWADNGDKVGSCDELVYEQYPSFSKAWDQLGLDERANVEKLLAKGNGPPTGSFLSTGVVGEKGQDPVKLEWPGQKGPKNEFFAFKPGPYPTGAVPYKFAPDLLELVGKGKKFVAKDLAYHTARTKANLKVADYVLDGFAARREAFVDLQTRRAARYDAFERAREEAEKAGKPDLAKSLAEAAKQDLYTLDAQIESALLDAQDAGCLSLQQFSCDWSHRDFTAEIERQVFDNLNTQYQRCDAAMNRGLGDSLIQHYGAFILPAGFWIDLINQMTEEIRGRIPDEPISGGNREALRRIEREDGWREGNSTIGGGVDYYVGVGFEDGVTSVCNAELFAKGELMADVSLLDNRTELVFASLTGGTDGNEIYLDSEFRVVGNEIAALTRNEREPNTFYFAENLSDGFSAGASFTYPLWFINLGISAGFTAGFGIDVSLAGGVRRDCDTPRLDVGVSGDLRPWTDIDMTFSGGIRTACIFGNDCAIGAEVSANFELVELAVPFHFDVGFATLTADLRDVYFHASATADLIVELLKGTIHIHAWCFGPNYDRDIWSGTAFEDNIHLFDWNHEVWMRRLFP